MPYDFSANQTVEDINSVPSDFRPFYVEASDGSGFTLSDSAEVTSAVKVISGLYRTVSSARREADDNKKNSVDLSPLSEYGTDVESILEGVKSAIEGASKGGEGSTDEAVKSAVEKLRGELNGVHEAEKNKWGEREGNLIGEIRKLLVDNKITEAMGDKVVSPLIAKRVLADLVDIDTDADGNFRTIVKGEDGKARTNVTDGQLVTVKDLVKELSGHEDYKALFKSEAPAGSGSHPGAPGQRVAAAAASQQGDKKSPVDKIKAGLAARSR